MKLYFVAVEHGDGIVYQLTMSDNYIPLWKKAGIYDLLYAPNDGVTCKQILPELMWALTDMCIYYIDYCLVIQLPPIKKQGKVTDAKLAISFRDDMDDMLREQIFRQACATLSILIQKAKLYPRSCVRQEKEEGHD